MIINMRTKDKRLYAEIVYSLIVIILIIIGGIE